MKQPYYYLGLLLVIAILYMIPSCAPGPVVMQTNSHTYYKGNWHKFEMRRLADSARKEQRLARVNGTKKEISKN